jgi:uncharacterized damage-inducible protein DinB
MQSTENPNDLIIHMEWADSCLWKAVSENGDRDSKVETCLHHIHLVQHAFLSLWRGEPLDLPEASHFVDEVALARWGRQGHIGIQKFIDSAEESALQRELAILWSGELAARWDGPVEAVSVHQSILQVTMHSVHHRGQVALRLRELNIEPPMFDFIVWLWRGRPRAQWPMSRNE